MSAATRQRRWRRRQRRGIAVLPVECDLARLAERLIDDGRLSEDDALVFQEVCAAIERLVQEYVDKM